MLPSHARPTKGYGLRATVPSRRRAWALLPAYASWLAIACVELRDPDAALGAPEPVTSMNDNRPSAGGTSATTRDGGEPLPSAARMPETLEPGQDAQATPPRQSPGDAASATRPPLLAFDHYRFARGLPDYEVAAPGVLANDSPGELQLAAGSFSTQQGGLVELAADGGFTYSPPSQRYWGDDHFSYTASDVTAWVRVTLQPDGLELGDVEQRLGNGFALRGASEFDQMGTSVARAGDINGDGIDDLLLGAPGANAGRSNVYVVFGKPDRLDIQLASADSEQPSGFAILATLSTDLVGTAVASAGDVNGDGLDDVIIGATGAGAGRGSAYVVLGKPDQLNVALASLESSGAGGYALHGASELDDAGFSVSGAGDVNGDGLGDLIVGAPGASRSAGSAYVVWGNKDGAGIELASLDAGATSGFVIRGALPGDQAGFSVSGAGDVNGDGLGDLVVGARGRNGSVGAAYVVWGRRDSLGVDLASLESEAGGGFAIHGVAEEQFAGATVAGVGDVNGDGLDDVIVGAPGASASIGAAYVVFGKQDGRAAALARSGAAATGGFAIRGEAEYDHAGHSVAGAGDVNGDGLDDVIVGHFGESVSQAYLVFGQRESPDLELARLAGDPARGLVIRARPAPPDDQTGVVVAGAGDVNADGLDDLIIGDLGVETATGEAYVLFGWDASDALGERAQSRLGGPLGDAFLASAEPLVRMSGKHGTDVLRLTGSGVTLDLSTTPSLYRSIEVLDLSGSGPNALRLSDSAVRRLPETRVDLAFPLAKTLEVRGDADDRILFDLAGNGYQPCASDAAHVVYCRPGMFYGLDVQSGVAFEPPPPVMIDAPIGGGE